MTPEVDGARRPLLIIDDDEDMHVFVRNELRHAGITHPVVSSYSGDEAIALLGAAQGADRLPCVALLDVKLPGMTGLDVLAWMRNQHLLGRICVAMLTGSDDPKLVAQAMSLGAHSYLLKPAKRQVLADLVHSAIRLTLRKTPSTSPRPPAQGTVLVVDDSAFARRWTRALLEKMGYEVAEASSGPEALTYFAAEPPNLMLLDMSMPGPSGLDVLREVRAAHRLLPIVVVTADTQTTTRDAVLAAGATGVINKPITDEKLRTIFATAR